MISVTRSGHYKLVETKHHTKILYLGNESYAWIEPAYIGQILVISHKPHKTDCVLSSGKFFMYEVNDEPYLSDQIHLELAVGDNLWQGYLLLTGLPNPKKKKSRIIPTQEVITNNSKFANRYSVLRQLAVKKSEEKEHEKALLIQR